MRMRGDVGDGAAVDDDGGGVRNEAVGDAPAVVAQTARHCLGVGDVELAAEGEDGGGSGVGHNQGSDTANHTSQPRGRLLGVTSDLSRLPAPSPLR